MQCVTLFIVLGFFMENALGDGPAFSFFSGLTEIDNLVDLADRADADIINFESRIDLDKDIPRKGVSGKLCSFSSNSDPIRLDRTDRWMSAVKSLILDIHSA